MTQSTVAIVGSGVAGSLIAYQLTRRGYDVEVFEKGPDYPYPHLPQFQDHFRRRYDNPIYRLPPDLQNLTVSGEYSGDPNQERFLALGGSANHWGAIALRGLPHDFKTRSLYRYGQDWPLSYDDLEPYYCAAEELLGVSGTDADNPFAPPRSRPYPLPPFALSYDDRILAARLRAHGIALHTTPQARTRLAYDDRPGCHNFGACTYCPIGVRYSPIHHLVRAVATGRCKIHLNTSVRRIVVDDSGRARALVYHPNDAKVAREHGAKVIIIAAHTIESTRLLLLSSRDRHPDGLPNLDHVGQHFTCHHEWKARLLFSESFFSENVGFETGQSYQFMDPPGRGRHGGIKVTCASKYGTFEMQDFDGSTGAEIVEQMQTVRRSRLLQFHGESLGSPKKFVTLSEKRDRFGDPFAHLHYESSEFDRATYRLAEQIYDRFVEATTPEHAALDGVDHYWSGGHHMGTCRMGLDARDSVVDQFGRFHGSHNLFVIGGSNFVSALTVNPTLTIAALALRAADYIADQQL